MHRLLLMAVLAVPMFGQRIEVPRAAAPVVDGTIGAEEWKSATRITLRGGGEALLQHDGTFLFVAFAVPRNGIGSICSGDASSIRILHASAALGTAQFEGGKRTRDFTWTNRDTSDAAARDRFLAAEHWFANATPRGSQEREYQIRVTAKEFPLALAFMSFAPNEERAMHVWPEKLADACASADLASGDTNKEYVFDPKQWAVISLR